MPANPANRANLLQADAKALVVEAAAEQAIISEKRPLFRELPPPPQFPVDALGPLKEPALAIQSKTQAPIAICAQSVLAVATLAVQAHIDVELPGGGIKPAVNMFVSIAESGERKTSVDKIALAPVRDMESQWNRDHKHTAADYENRLVAWKTARLGVKKGAVPDIVAALGQIGLEPEAPPHPMLICSDVTPEALVRRADRLRRHRASLCFASTARRHLRTGRLLAPGNRRPSAASFVPAPARSRCVHPRPGQHADTASRARGFVHSAGRRA